MSWDEVVQCKLQGPNEYTASWAGLPDIEGVALCAGEESRVIVGFKSDLDFGLATLELDGTLRR